MASNNLSNLRVVDPVLTELAVGFQPVGMIGTQILTEVTSPKEAGHIPKFTKETLREYATKRAPRAKSNRMNPDGVDDITFVMEEHDIEYPIDIREANEDIVNRRETGSRFVKGVIEMQKERDIATLVLDASQYQAANKVTLAGNAQWSDFANSTPVEDVQDWKEAIRKAIGFRPNKLMFGAEVFAKLVNHPKIIARLTGFKREFANIDDLKNIFGMEEIIIGDSVTATDADVLSDVWGKFSWLGFTRKTNDRYMPNFGYTIKKTTGFIVDRYEEVGGKVEIVRGTDIYVPKLLIPEAGFLASAVIA